jgi:hypothetical protein
MPFRHLVLLLLLLLHLTSLVASLVRDPHVPLVAS